MDIRTTPLRRRRAVHPAEEAIVLSTLERPGVPGEPAPQLDRPAHSAHRLRTALMAAIGLVVGIGVTYVALRPDPTPSVFSGPPSVQEYDRPARTTGEQGIALPPAFEAARPSAEPASAKAALTAFLAAEIADLAGDAPQRSTESFALLDPATQKLHGSVAAWRATRSERVIPSAYEVRSERRGPADRIELTIEATRTPSITPFRGLVAARTTEVWSVAKDAAGWRIVDGRPRSSIPELPSDGAAAAAAKTWVEGAARCDKSILDLQLERTLLGNPELSQSACRAKGDWSTGAIVPVDELGDITSFVAAYGSSVGGWGRGVVVTNGQERFTVVLGPVGEQWRVLGLLDAEGA